MTAKTRLTPVVAVLLVALGDGSSSVGSARAAENCLAAPNAQAPQGSHWYYRTDPVKQSKCWYLRTEGQAIQKPSAPEGPDPTVTAKWPAAATSKTAPDQSAPAVSGGNLMRGSIQGDAQASRQPRADAVGWPESPSPASSNNVVWPDPPSPAGGAAQGGIAESTPEGRANQTQEVPATAANSDKNAGNDARGDRHVEMAASHSEMPVGMLLAFAIGLVIAGILVRRIVRMTFARRRTVRPDRQEPVWTTSIASERTKPTFVVHDTDCLDDEVKDALRKIVRVLDRQAV